jgi:hypothetical protein
MAIIVGSMPAFATFFKVHVVRSSRFQAVLSLFSSKKSQDTSVSDSNPQTPLRTFGASGPKVHPYYELNESALLKSQCTTSGEVIDAPNIPDRAIVRTVGIYQQTGSTFPKSAS